MDKTPGIILYTEDIERIKKSVKPQYQFAVIYALSVLATTGEYPTEEQLGEGGMVAFSFIVDKVSDALQKYRETSEKRKEAASKRWDKSETMQTDANECKSIQVDAKAPKTETETETEIENKNINEKQEIKERRTRGDGVAAKFEIFWKAYPRKVGKGAAQRIFERLRPDDMLFAKMLKAVDTARASPQWQKDGGQYIPNPATWLNQKRWEDEPTEAPTDFQRRKYEKTDFDAMYTDVTADIAAMKAAGQ